MAVIAARVRYTFTSLLANGDVCVFPRIEIPEVCSNGAPHNSRQISLDYQIFENCRIQWYWLHLFRLSILPTPCLAICIVSIFDSAILHNLQFFWHQYGHFCLVEDLLISLWLTGKLKPGKTPWKQWYWQFRDVIAHIFGTKQDFG